MKKLNKSWYTCELKHIKNEWSLHHLTALHWSVRATINSVFNAIEVSSEVYTWKYDFENYLSTLLYPKTYRSAAFAIRSLNVEIAQVRDVISDKNIGVMRMKFWEDAIDAIYQIMLLLSFKSLNVSEDIDEAVTRNPQPTTEEEEEERRPLLS